MYLPTGLLDNTVWINVATQVAYLVESWATNAYVNNIEPEWTL